MKGAFPIFVFVLATGCWQGPTAEGVYRCSTDAECPADWVCVTEAGGGRCYSDPGVSRCDGGACMDGGRECDGCVDGASGVCLGGEAVAACGSGGAMCLACDMGQQCVDGACITRETCGPGDCEGCCDGNACVTANRNDACGGGGAACMACSPTETCTDGSCVEPSVCNPSNCGGCCNGDICELGDDALACGFGGGPCSFCGGAETCLDNFCTLPCAERCGLGCCDGENCLDGNADTACGAGGRACLTCDSGSMCDGFGCLDTGCSETCEGCCDGDVCLTGELPGACGSLGFMCVDCGFDFQCSDGRCLVDPASRWNVTIARASLPTLDSGGFPWDVSGGLPDPIAYVEAESGGSPLSGDTGWLEDTVNPNWNAQVLDGVRADDLRRGLRITVEDFDTFSGNDTMLLCFLLPSSDNFRDGLVVVDCPASSSPTTVAGEVVIYLDRS